MKVYCQYICTWRNGLTLYALNYMVSIPCWICWEKKLSLGNAWYLFTNKCLVSWPIRMSQRTVRLRLAMRQMNVNLDDMIEPMPMKVILSIYTMHFCMASICSRICWKISQREPRAFILGAYGSHTKGHSVGPLVLIGSNTVYRKVISIPIEPACQFSRSEILQYVSWYAH